MCRAFVDRVFDVEDLLGHFDVIHAHDWLTANAMIWIKQGRGHKCVLTIHATEYARCGNCFHNGRSQRIRDQERAGTYWADQVIAVSHATKKELMWMYEAPDWKTSVVYNGVSPHRFDGDVDAGQIKRHYQIGPMDPTVLFCGRLTHQKGPDLLVEAIPSILRSHPRAKFAFLGDGEMRGSLEHRARQLGAGDAVRFLGYRNGQELVNLFKSCEAVCVPSRNEPFGIVVLEGWSAGKPVIVTQNGGPDEYVRHEQNGLKIHPRPDSVAWGVGTLFMNFDWARWMGQNGRQDVERQFTWDRIAEQTLTVYDPQWREKAWPQQPAPTPAVVAEAASAAPACQQPEPAAPAYQQSEPAAMTCRQPEPVSSTCQEPEPADSTCQPGEAGLRVAVEISLGSGQGTGEAPTEAAQACQRVLAEAGYPGRVDGGSVRLEGSWEQVLPVARRCCLEAERAGGSQASVPSLVPQEETSCLSLPIPPPQEDSEPIPPPQEDSERRARLSRRRRQPPSKLSTSPAAVWPAAVLAAAQEPA
jgi:glycosyltransferase involved in cell wall biosynthesis